MVGLIEPKSELGLSFLDVRDDVANADQLLGFFVGDLNTEFLFNSHNEFNCVKGIGAKIFDHFWLGRYLISGDAELLHDDFGDFFYNIFCHGPLD